MGSVVLEKHTASIFRGSNLQAWRWRHYVTLKYWYSFTKLQAWRWRHYVTLKYWYSFTKLEHVISWMTTIRNLNYSRGKIEWSFISLSAICLNTALANSLMLALCITSCKPVLYLWVLFQYCDVPGCIWLIWSWNHMYYCLVFKWWFHNNATFFWLVISHAGRVGDHEITVGLQQLRWTQKIL
jgi:hypothetical protein